MKKLVIGSVFALAAIQAAGCVSDNSCDPAIEDCGGGGDVPHVNATWQVKTVNGSNISCPPNGQTAALFNAAVDANGNLIAPCTGPGSISGTCFVDLFNCEDHAGQSSELPAARYLTWIALTDDSGNQVYAKSLSAYVDITDTDKTFSASIFDDGGYFSLTWDLEGAQSGNPLTCSQAGADQVEAVVTVSGGSTMIDTNPWACDDHYGVTSVIPEGQYTVSVDAFNGNGSLGTAPTFTTETISGPNQVTDLDGL